MGRAGHVHIFDESHFRIVCAPKPDQIAQLVIIDAPDDHRVDLGSGESFAARGGDPVKDSRMLVAARDGEEAFRSQRVETDGDSMETGATQRPGLPGEQDSVCRECEIFDQRIRRQQTHQAIEVPPKKRFTAGQSYAPHSKGCKDVDELDQLFEAQQMVLRQPAIMLFRHAIHAPQIAAVGHREAQACERPPKRVSQRMRRRMRSRIPI